MGHPQPGGAAPAIPPEWEKIAKTTRRSKKTRVTMCVEEHVVKFFKSMGPGYQARMNEVLGAFVEAKLSGILEDRYTINRYFERAETEHRPWIGETEADMEEVRANLARDKDA